VAFLRHNAGIAYRVELPSDGQRFLLKIFQPVGNEAAPAPARLRAGLTWLAALLAEKYIRLRINAGRRLTSSSTISL
jgi:hypothetical protein